MESLFPDLLFLGPYFAPFILRIALAGTFIMYAYSAWKSFFPAQALSVTQALIGILFIIGLFTQAVALITITFIIFKNPVARWFGIDDARRHPAETLLIIGASLALIILGAGAFAVDLPY